MRASVNPPPAAAKPCVGLIGGIAIGASCEYYKRLAKAFAREDLPFAMVLVHAQLSVVLEYMRKSDEDGLGAYFASLIEQLAGAAATCACITSVASHMAYAATAQHSSLPLISLPQAVRQEIGRQRLGRIALFGSRFAMQTAMSGELEDIVEVIPLRSDEFGTIDQLYMQIATRGVASEAQERLFSSLAFAVLKREKLDAVVLAGTDLAVLYGEHRRPTFPSLDVTDAHVEAILDACRTT